MDLTPRKQAQNYYVCMSSGGPPKRDSPF